MPLPAILLAIPALAKSSIWIALAIKFVISTLCIVLVPLIYKYIMIWKGDMIFNAVFGFLNDVGVPVQAIKLTGVAAWFAVQFRLMEVLAVILSALMCRFMMDMVFKR